MYMYKRFSYLRESLITRRAMYGKYGRQSPIEAIVGYRMIQLP